MELKEIKARAEKSKKVSVRTKEPTTRLTHALIDMEFTATPVELGEIDGWVQAQIDAGKLETC